MASALSQQPNNIVFPVWKPEAKKGLSAEEGQLSVGHLPYDIWVDIIILLADDKPTLSQLALLSREHHSFILPTLYRHIDLVVPRREKEFRQHIFRNPNKRPLPRDHQANWVKAIPSSSPFALFLRTVEDSPSLGQLVKTAKLTRPESDKAVDAAVNLLFEKLPNLRKLTLDANWTNGEFGATFFERNPMDLLRHVELLRPGGYGRLVDIFLQQSHIESMTTEGPLFRLPMPDWTMRNTSSLLTLKILDSAGDNLSDIELQRLLAWPRALEHLHCDFPVGRLWSSYVKEVADPTALLRILQPVSRSMKELKLHCYKWRFTSNGSQLDLSSGFPCLRVLQILAICLFAAERPEDTRNGAYKLLPPTLQELTVSRATTLLARIKQTISKIWLSHPSSIQVLFTRDWGMFYHSRKTRNIWWKKRRMEGEDPATYEWLTELAQHKTSEFGCLKRVEILEEGGSVRWTAPKTVRALFDTAGIALDVRLRGGKSRPQKMDVS